MQSFKQSSTYLPLSLLSEDWKLILLLAGLVFTAYAPALNNGFISDDYVILQRTEELKQSPLSLFSIPPESFRLTTYLCFLLLKSCFGYCSPLFYAFAILLHFANVLMLRKLLYRFSESKEVSAFGAVIFATIQNPQEGVFWLAGMNEVLLGGFALAALLLWIKDRPVLSSLSCVTALLSKESAVILAALVPFQDFRRTRRLRYRKEYLFLFVPTLVCALLYLYSSSTNPLLTSRLYAFRPQAIGVLLNSLHRLLFPWGYAMLVLVVIMRGWSELRITMSPLAWIGLTLTPYVFLTYQSHVPSRNQYLASMGVAWLLALLAGRLPAIRWRYLVVAAFVISNIAYIWLRKDAQYVQRAAPTDRLIQELRSRTPSTVRIVGFPGNPWIAKETTLVVPGWSSDMLAVNEPAETCPRCPALIWDGRLQKYSVSPSPP